MHEQQVDVARVVQLGAAELAQADHGQPVLTGRQPAGLGEARLRDRRDLGDDVLERRPAQIARGNTKHRATPEEPEPVLGADALDVASELGVELLAGSRLDVGERGRLLRMANQQVCGGRGEPQDPRGDRKHVWSFQLLTSSGVRSDTRERGPGELGVGRVSQRSIQGLGARRSHDPNRSGSGGPSAQSEHRVGLDLDPPSRIEERAHHHHRAGRPHLGEDLTVGAADLLPIAGVAQVHARPHDVLRSGTGLAQCGDHDLPAARGLAVRVDGRVAAVGHDGRGPRDEHPITDHERPREPDDGLVGRPAADVSPVHGGTVPRVGPAAQPPSEEKIEVVVVLVLVVRADHDGLGHVVPFEQALHVVHLPS